MPEAKVQANETPKPMHPSTNPSWKKLSDRIAQAELQLKGGNLTPAETAQFQAALDRDRIKLVEVETAINDINSAPTTSSQDRREAELNRREGQLRAGENALVEREAQLRSERNAVIEREQALATREADLTAREAAFDKVCAGTAAPPTTDASSIL